MNYYPMSFPGLFSAEERAFSLSHESNNEDPDWDSANEAYSKKVVQKNKIIKDRSYEHESNRASTEMYLS